MTPTRWMGLAAMGLGVAAMVGCGDSDADPDGTGAAGGTGNVGNVGNQGGAGNEGGGGTGNTGDGNDSFEEAVEIELGEDVFGTLEPIETDRDYYKFTGTAGDFIFIDTLAKPEADPFSAEYPDVVITVYDENQMQIAENDDPFLVRDTNDSELITRLPSTGTYYVRITDCLAWENGGPDNCFPAEGITTFDYGLRVSRIDTTVAGNVEDGELGNDETTANLMTYAPNGAGAYFASLVVGDFANADDIDVYSVTPPADIVLTNTPFGAFFIDGPEGIAGSGTTNNIGPAWITDAGGTILSRIDHSLGATEASREIRAPMTPGVEYFLWLQHPGAPAGGNDFYVLTHAAVGSNPVEPNDAANNNLITADVLSGAANGDLFSYFVSGTLPDGDIDHFSIEVPFGFDATTGTVSVACGAHRSGSGVRGMTATLLNGSNGQEIMASMAETEAAPLSLSEVAIGVSETALAVRVQAGTADATVTSRFYQCGFHFVTATP